ncbi:hypothetical protein [Erwinia sp. JH02]|uniref:hypothetical protein n=1 Tax=Erwinia sp. JH02 TaxID=2733394 RepID=UPI001488FF7B|nr:hypothetical protein [Erwinia sp. JH02]NNS06006.1 hypothetical protein [Erwinia sp. JH02]
MADPLEQLVKAQRIDFIVKFMICSEVVGQERELLDIWLSELTEDLIVDLKGCSQKESLQ